MATPHVAGLAALLFEACPGATADQIERAILDSCTLTPGMMAERAGQGVPDGPTALAKLLNALGLSGPSGITNQSTPKKRRQTGGPTGSPTKPRRSG